MANLFPRVFGRAGATPERAPKDERGLVPAVITQGDMAIDTVADMLRILGQYPLDQEQMETTAFTVLCEQWAQHVTLAIPPPVSATTQPLTAPEAGEVRRDWTAVREFVRSYCKSGVGHTRNVMSDLRQVVWVFIENLNQSFSQVHESDSRMREQLERLERLAQSSSTGELKKEVLATVVAMSQVMEQRRQQQQASMEDLGGRVRSLGQELEIARRESEIDPLTKLYNRKAFDDYVTHTVELTRAFGHEASLLFVDADHFKTVNDVHGHTTGDDLLKKLADRVARLFLRKSDFVARYGGDELAVVLRETPARDALALAERLVKASQAIELERGGVRIPVTVSVGVAPARLDDDVKSWLDRADRALYAAKQAGRDRATLADD